jgi:hypothetical protein
MEFFGLYLPTNIWLIFSRFHKIQELSNQPCQQAYRQAEKDMIALNTPELHSNKGIALKYEEDYVNALKCLKRSQELGPTWDAPLNLE